MIDVAEGFGRLAAAFLATRENANTRAAYARDLAALADALGVPPPPRRRARRSASRTTRPRARPPRRSRRSRSTGGSAGATGCPGRLSTRRRRVAAARAFCRWWARAFALENPARDLRPPAAAGRGRPGGDRPRGGGAVPGRRAARCARPRAGPGPLGARTSALVEVLYGCGLRASEAAGLDLSACHLDDPDDPFLLVRGQGRAAAGRWRCRARRSRACAPTCASGRPELRARDRRPRRDQARHRDADAVFLSARGRRLGRGGGVAHRGRRRPTGPGLRDDGARVFPHALRHSCGTHLIQSGVDIRYVQAHLGHASPVTTEVYTHVTAAHLREDFDRAHPRARTRRLPPGDLHDDAGAVAAGRRR